DRLDVGRRVNSLDFSPDGRTLALTSDVEDVVSLWDVESRQKRFSLTAVPGAVERPSFTEWNMTLFSRDGARLFVTDNASHGVVVWDVATRKLLTRLAHSNIVRSLSLARDGRTLLTFTGTHTITAWDTRGFSRVDIPSEVEGQPGIPNAQIACGKTPLGE